MRFEDENGEWIKFNPDFCSNHFGTYKKCGEWAVPVFPSNSSLVGCFPIMRGSVWSDAHNIIYFKCLNLTNLITNYI